MANFAQVRATITSMEKAAAILPQLQAIYQQAQFAKAAIELYQAGTDATFNQAVNAIFTANERSQLATMLNQVNTLVGAWEANHASLLGIDTGA
jgi:hypothetical protein